MKNELQPFGKKRKSEQTKLMSTTTMTTNISSPRESMSIATNDSTSSISSVTSNDNNIVGSSNSSTSTTTTRSNVEEEEKNRIHRPILVHELDCSSFDSTVSVGKNSNSNTNANNAYVSSLPPPTENSREEVIVTTNNAVTMNTNNDNHSSNGGSVPHIAIVLEREEETQQQEEEDQQQQNQQEEPQEEQEKKKPREKQKKAKRNFFLSKMRSKPSYISTSINDVDREGLVEVPALPFASTASSSSTTIDDTNINALQWLQAICPDDIAPVILAFCGPQLMQSLDKTSQYWNNRLKEEATWRILCEELYKWKKGDPKPNSWKEHYRLNPCVPIDYHSVSRALNILTTFDNNNKAVGLGNMEAENQPHCLTILLRPGKYIFKEALIIETHPSHHVSIQSMNMPSSLPIEEEPKIFFDNGKHVGGITSFYSSVSAGSMVARGNVPHGEGAREGQRKLSFREYFSCMSKRSVQVETRSDNGEDEHYHDVLDTSLHSPSSEHESSYTNIQQQQQHGQCSVTQKVEIFLQTRRHNEPIFRVCQGNFSIKNIYLVHHSNGVDIWNGNAAIQVQPPIQEDDEETVNNDGISVRTLSQQRTSPLVTLESIFVTSRSGRGIVNLNGGRLMINDCYVRDCAGTGIYVGGKGCKTDIINTDVVRNGIGANRSGVATHVRRGVQAGHSGIYLEQGTTKVIGCNVSQNSLTGISAMSPDDCVLYLQHCDLIGNGTSHQIELPPIGTLSRANSTIGNVVRQGSNNMNNQFRSNGLVKCRSSVFHNLQRFAQQQHQHQQEL